MEQNRLKQIKEESTHRNASVSHNNSSVAQVDQACQPHPSSDMVIQHKALNMLMKKAAKFDRESTQVIELTKQSDMDKDSLVLLAENFTTKEHF